MSEDGGGLWGTTGGRPGTPRVMSHDGPMIRSDSYEINSSQPPGMSQDGGGRWGTAGDAASDVS